MERDDLRDDLRAEPRKPYRDPAARAAEIRSLVGQEPEFHDDLLIPKEEIPPGWEYQWKAESVVGKTDRSYLAGVYRRGWEPVPAGRHPLHAPFGLAPDEPIRRDGLILCEMPAVLTAEARARDKRLARESVQEMDRKLFEPDSSPFERRNINGRSSPVSREWVSPIPED